MEENSKEKEHQQLCMEIIHQSIGVSHNHRRAVERYSLEHNLPKNQHRLLLTLAEMGPNVCQRDLAAKLQVTPAAVAVTLRKLEKSGVIEKKVSQKDNRYNRVILTDKGNLIVEKSRQAFSNIDKGVFESFSEEEMNDLLGYLKRLNQNLRKLIQRPIE